LVLTVVTLLIGSILGFYSYARSQWRAAVAALEEGRPAAARQHLRICLRAWPSDGEVHRLAGRAARLDLDFDAAEKHLHRSLQLQGGATEAIQLEFLLLRAQAGQVDEVAAPLLKCVEDKHPESPIILETLARHYMRNLQLKEAYACLSEWIELQPHRATPYHWRGWVHERLNNYRRGMEDYQKALELDPELFGVRLRVAEILLEDKLPLEALTHLDYLRQRHPDKPEVKARLGQVKFLQGENEEARELLESAAASLPKDHQVLLSLGKLELQEGRAEQAEQWLNRVLEIDPTDTEAAYALVSALRLQGRELEAKAMLESYEKNKALLETVNRLLREEALRPNRDPQGPWEIGRILLSIGRDRLGIHWLTQALERDPHHQPSHRLLAEYYEKKGDHQRAGIHRRWLREPTPDPTSNVKKSGSPNETNPASSPPDR
jgi:tetratricopeptide (TPR) repeat protein